MTRFAQKRDAPFFFERNVRLSRNDSHAEILDTRGHQTRCMRGDITTRALFNPGRDSRATGSRVPDPVGAASVIGFVTMGDHQSAIASAAHNFGRRSRDAKLAHFFERPGIVGRRDNAGSEDRFQLFSIGVRRCLQSPQRPDSGR